ncbi:hypothetical protein SAMN05518684_109107 [Salipaludibacillus aurantiacus]|uniref:Uncharacterized protein n=1 Tax=Salipaludibacillus aurantiacus TaxID=1601833 RepID=A0A1H9V2T0_9BACI|nr:hypothetical protein SAMN05518684_109107 [Salipaludibacillus aurantiacus]
MKLRKTGKSLILMEVGAHVYGCTHPFPERTSSGN